MNPATVETESRISFYYFERSWPIFEEQECRAILGYLCVPNEMFEILHTSLT